MLTHLNRNAQTLIMALFDAEFAHTAAGTNPALMELPQPRWNLPGDYTGGIQ